MRDFIFQSIFRLTPLFLCCNWLPKLIGSGWSPPLIRQSLKKTILAIGITIWMTSRKNCVTNWTRRTISCKDSSSGSLTLVPYTKLTIPRLCEASWRIWRLCSNSSSASSVESTKWKTTRWKLSNTFTSIITSNPPWLLRWRHFRRKSLLVCSNRAPTFLPRVAMTMSPESILVCGGYLLSDDWLSRFVKPSGRNCVESDLLALRHAQN